MVKYSMILQFDSLKIFYVRVYCCIVVWCYHERWNHDFQDFNCLTVAADVQKLATIDHPYTVPNTVRLW